MRPKQTVRLLHLVQIVALVLIVSLLSPLSSSEAGAPPPPRKAIPVSNASLTGAVTASSSAGPDHAPNAALDPRLDTSWRAAGTGRQWLQVDLGRPYAVSSLRQTFADRDVWSFTISGSLDGTTWMTLVDRSPGIAGQTFAESVTGIYRYVRLTVTDAAHDSVPSSAELLVQGSGSELEITTPGTKVETSSAGGGYDGRFAVDRDSSTFWGAGAGSLPQWLTVDLGKVTDFVAVEQNFKDYGEWRYTISGSNDNENFTTLVDHGVGEGTSPVTGQSIHDPVKAAYRYVRLTIHGTRHGYWAGSTSFKVFAAFDAASPSWLNRDLADGTVATSSSLSVGFEPWNAVDSQPSTAWIAESRATPQWLQVDLGHLSSITGVEQTFLDSDTWHFMLEGSADGRSWKRLLDKRNGANGRVFSASVKGSYRYVRLTVPKPSAHGRWANSQQLRILGNGSPVRNRRWIERSRPLQRFYVKHYVNKLKDITAQLDDLREQGYGGIEIAAPYKGPRTPWAGLGATDNYAIDPSIGTMADFERLIARAHQLGMKVVFFGNPGYASPEAPFWIKAQKDPNSVERKWFDIQPAYGPQACKAEDRRYWSELAKGCYFSFWTDPFNPNNHMPAYNFGNPEWRDETAKIIKFWMDKGVDGFGADAPRAYLNVSTEISKKYITGVLDNYDSWTFPEGLQPDWGGGRPGDLLNGVPELRFNTIHDLFVSWWACTTQCSRIVPAIESGNPSALENTFKESRDTINQQGGITMSMPSWDSDVNSDGTLVPERVKPASVRLLEMATILGSGNQFYMNNGNHLYLADQRTIPTWSEEQQALVYKLLRAQGSTSALAPRGLRYRASTNDDSKYYAFVRSDKADNTKAVVVLNFQNSEQTIDVDLRGTGIAPDQAPIDLLNGQTGGTIADGRYRVTLPARGFALLSVR